jgi:hypothetical protein
MYPTRRQLLLVLPLAWLLPATCRAAPIADAGRLHVDGGRFCDETGRPVALYGVNLFQSHLMWSRRQDLAEAEAALEAISELGFNAVRMPLNMAWFEPEPNVFPGDPQYESILTAHGLPTGALAFYDGLVRRAGELGLYVIPEFHELPSDPYRWFVGGEERDRGTDRPGRAIAWMAQPDEANPGRYHTDPELAAKEVPRALGWLAEHWRGVPNIAGIEVPWNEPRGSLAEPGAYFDLCRNCAGAVKAADPDRLVFMDCVDWGAMVNRIPDESVWKTPDQVDALFPHFYPGLHSNNSGEAGTWSTTMANWASWLMGSGRPVMVGEYGVVEMTRAGYWKDGVTDAQRAATYAACLAQWYAMGVQGVFCWAWDGGIGRDPGTGALNQGAEELVKWAAPYRETVPCAAEAEIAVVCAPEHRASYGGKKDLWLVTDALLDAHLTPFATVFSSQVLQQPEALTRFSSLIVLDADLPEAVRDAVRQAGKRTFWLTPDLAGLEEAVTGLRQAAGATPESLLPASVVVGYAAEQATVYERKGQAGPVHLRLHIPGADGAGALVDPSGETLFSGRAQQLAVDGTDVELLPWQCKVLHWRP